MSDAVLNIERFHMSRRDLDDKLGRPDKSIQFPIEIGKQLCFSVYGVLHPDPHHRPDIWCLGGYGRLKPNHSQRSFYVVKISLAYGEHKVSVGGGTARRRSKKDWEALVALLDPERETVRRRKEIWLSAEDARNIAENIGVRPQDLAKSVVRLIAYAGSKTPKGGRFTSFRVREIRGTMQVGVRSVVQYGKDVAPDYPEGLGEGTFKHMKLSEEWYNEAEELAGSFQ